VAYELPVPDFLQNQDEETIYQRMKSNTPADLDTSEGSFFWDVARPAALEKAEMLQFHLTETLKIMFPMWAYDTWLDLHAKGNGLERKPANPASGTLVIAGVSGTTIPAGSRFAVPAIGDTPAIEYETKEKYTIREDGTVEAQVTAIEAGTQGNVPAGAVSLMMTPINGITTITNPEQISGGTEAESDDELRRRIDEMDATSEASFVGSNGDYKRWAEEVSGVGTALVMPEWAGPGTVKVVVIDANGQPANESIITAVYNYIMSPDDRLQRKAPVGATVTVEAPAAKTIDYVFVLELEAGETQETVIERFVANLQAYYIEAKKEEVVRYTRIGSILTSTSGVKDYAGLTINAGTANITLSEDEYPITGTIDPTGGGGTS
jgi:uncharacterized phage protein gp47/JayE